MSILITKADGTQEPFAEEKLHASLKKAGADDTTTAEIVSQVTRELRPLMRTSDIYQRAFLLLKNQTPHGIAARYSLRRAILDFGPTGFPFEAYVAELFRTEGYEATTNVMAHGRCVVHEIDVLLKKGGHKIFVEAKFHNTPGFKTDLKVVLYVKARIDDLIAREGPQVSGMVLTNTKFTSSAIEYAHCAGLPLLGWDYPSTSNLQTMVDASGLYPITALASLTKKEKLALMSQKVVLCNALPRHADTLRGLGLKQGRLTALFEEVGNLCGSQVAV